MKHVHTARVGRTPFNGKGRGAVAFAVAAMRRFAPAPEALEFSVEYCSVVLFGVAVTVLEEVETRRALQLMRQTYAPHLRRGRDYRPTTDE